MEPTKDKRKLTAILMADAVGYSRLMGEDESETIRALDAHREVFLSYFQQHDGRIINTPGDSILAEFGSVVDAVSCAVDIQRVLAERNEGMPENRRMQFRIGINLGDVVTKGDEIYGDGVNIAARLESLAEPGGICISGTVYDHVEHRLPVEYEFLGPQSVKNIKQPVRVYRVLTQPGAKARQVFQLKRVSIGSWRKAGLTVVVILLVVGGAIAVWNFYFRPALSPEETASGKRLPLPKEPSIAVLPFANMSGDPKQEYFSDGITETLITDLSKISSLFVIARNSTFQYKGKSVDVRQVGRELGVRYVLEGSVQKAGDRVRINTQLVDGQTGDHLWSERYDRPLQDIFALQDEITRKIVTELDVQLASGEQARVWRKTTDSVKAYDFYVLGRSHYFKETPEGITEARQFFKSAMELDPDFTLAVVFLGWTYLIDVVHGYSQSPREAMERARELANRALSMDNSLADTYALLSYHYVLNRDLDQAIAYGEQAVALNPNSADSWVLLSLAFRRAGKYREALAQIRRAFRLNPYPPSLYFIALSHSQLVLKQYTEAIEASLKASELAPTSALSFPFRIIAYMESGREKTAQAEAAELRRVDPNFSVDNFVHYLGYHKDPAIAERWRKALAQAGLK